MTKKVLPRLQQFSDFASYNMAGDDEEAVAAVLQHIEQEVGIPAFLAATPSYYECPQNGERLIGWCKSRGIPLTQWNLTLAFRDLTEDGQLEAAPAPAAAVIDKMAGVTVVRSDVLMEYRTPEDEAAVLAKLADDPALSDRQRRERLRKLALLTGQQRRDLAPQNLYRCPRWRPWS